MSRTAITAPAVPGTIVVALFAFGDHAPDRKSFNAIWEMGDRIAAEFREKGLTRPLFIKADLPERSGWGVAGHLGNAILKFEVSDIRSGCSWLRQKMAGRGLLDLCEIAFSEYIEPFQTYHVASRLTAVQLLNGLTHDNLHRVFANRLNDWKATITKSQSNKPG